MNYELIEKINLLNIRTFSHLLKFNNLDSISVSYRYRPNNKPSDIDIMTSIYDELWKKVKKSQDKEHLFVSVPSYFASEDADGSVINYASKINVSTRKPSDLLRHITRGIAKLVNHLTDNKSNKIDGQIIFHSSGMVDVSITNLINNEKKLITFNTDDFDNYVDPTKPIRKFQINGTYISTNSNSDNLEDLFLNGKIDYAIIPGAISKLVRLDKNFIVSDMKGTIDEIGETFRGYEQLICCEHAVDRDDELKEYIKSGHINITDKLGNNLAMLMSISTLYGFKDEEIYLKNGKNHVIENKTRILNLIQSGIDLNHKNLAGNNLLDIAVKYKNTDIAEYLFNLNVESNYKIFEMSEDRLQNLFSFAKNHDDLKLRSITEEYILQYKLTTSSTPVKSENIKRRLTF